MLTPYRKSANLRTLSSSAFFRFFSSFPDCRNSASSEKNLGQFGSNDIMWYKIGLSKTTCSEGRDVCEDLLRPKSIVVWFIRKSQRRESGMPGDGAATLELSEDAQGFRVVHAMSALNVVQIRMMPCRRAQCNNRLIQRRADSSRPDLYNV